MMSHTRRMLVLAALTTALTTSIVVAAPNNSSQQDWQEGRMDRSPWTANLTVTGHDLQTENDTVQNTTFYSGPDEEWHVRFTGAMRTPTPCHLLTKSVRRTGRGEYEFRISSVVEDDTCAQRTAMIEYTANFETNERFNLTVIHDGDTVETVRTPRAAEQANEEPPQRQTLLQQLLSWLQNLF